MLSLTGVVPANILPFDEDGRIDVGEYRRHLEWLAETPGVTGLTCNGHAGEVAALDRDERRRAVAIAAEVVAGRVPLVAGVYAENSRQAIELARDAEAEGADALLVMPPNALLFGGYPEMAYRHHAELAEAVELPIVAFVYPAWTRMQYDVDTLLRICGIEAVAAVKEWSLDIAVFECNLRAVRGLDRPVSVLSSFSTNLLPSLVLGADGVLSGHGSVIADLQAGLLNAVRAGDRGAAEATYARIQVLTAAVYRDPMVDMYTRMKEQLVMLGRQSRAAVRPPLCPLSPAERADLRAALVRADVLSEADARLAGQKSPVTRELPGQRNRTPNSAPSTHA
ncbi:MAG: dihydrodipicolinate synthase family protein [Streptosporangiaceae bacterium]